MKFRLFISSVQSEFAEARQKLADYIRRDALLGVFYEPFLFEEVAACDRTPQDVYLNEVADADLYIGLFGLHYGSRDPEGVSPTEREYDEATKGRKHRLIYVLDDPQEAREESERLLVAKAEASVSRKNFHDFESLRAAVYTSLIRFLELKGKIVSDPFDIAKNRGFTMDDLDTDKFDRFVLVARRKKKVKLPDDLTFHDLLKMLDAIDSRGNVSNAAVLLFGKDTHSHFLSAEIKCAQFWGNEVAKPLPSYRIFTGTLIEQIEAAQDFVLSRIDNWVGSRIGGSTAQVPTEFELPEDAVKEAVVNAVCHRDYLDNGGVQVMLFKNRLEILNPGSLPKGWTVKNLIEGHKSRPRNESIALALHMAGYVEKAGSGTRDIISKCRAKGLKDPEYQSDGDDFSLTIWRKDQESHNRIGSEHEAHDKAHDKAHDGLMMGLCQAHDGHMSVREKVVAALEIALSRKEIAALLNISWKSGYLKKTIDSLVSDGIVSLTIPEKPKSRLQKYCLTGKGLALKSTFLSSQSSPPNAQPSCRTPFL